MTPLYGYSSPESAYLVADYPYSFKLRCRIRYWLEYKPKKGFRFVSQTENPKTGRWNAPKPSTYVDSGAAMYLDDVGHVQWTGVGEYTSAVKMLEFVTEFPGADLNLVTDLAKGAVNPKGLLAGLAAGRIRIKASINGVEQVPSPAVVDADIERYRADLAVWMRIAEKLGVLPEAGGA